MEPAEYDKLIQRVEEAIEKERYAKARWNPCSFLADLGISGAVLGLNTSSFETIVVLVAAAISTLLANYYKIGDTAFAAKLDFSLVSASIIFPVSFLISSTFKRREAALQSVTSTRSIVCNLAMAFFIWNWDSGKGRSKLPKEFSHDVLSTIEKLLMTCRTICNMPTKNRSWYRYSGKGKRRQEKLTEIENKLRSETTSHLIDLHFHMETIKNAGLAGSECSRISQYILKLQCETEFLFGIKAYRTPQATRSFLRFFVFLVVCLYGPYYSWVIGNTGAANTGVAFGVVLSVITAWALTGLIHIQRSMEDPFTSSFDGILIQDEFEEVITHLEDIKQKAELKQSQWHISRSDLLQQQSSVLEELIEKHGTKVKLRQQATRRDVNKRQKNEVQRV